MAASLSSSMDQSNGSEAGSAARDDYLQLHAEYVRSIKTLLSSLQPKFESSLHSFKEFQRCVAEGAAWGWAWGRRMTEFFFDLSLPEDLEVVRNYTHTPEPEVHKEEILPCPKPNSVQDQGWLYVWKLPWILTVESFALELVIVRIGTIIVVDGKSEEAPLDSQDALNALQRRFQEERDAYAQIGDAPDIPHRENGFYKSWEEVMNPFKFPDLGCLVQRSNARGDMSLECMEAIVSSIIGLPLPSALIRELKASGAPHGVSDFNLGTGHLLVVPLAAFNNLRHLFLEHGMDLMPQLSDITRELSGTWTLLPDQPIIIDTGKQIHAGTQEKRKMVLPVRLPHAEWQRVLDLYTNLRVMVQRDEEDLADEFDMVLSDGDTLRAVDSPASVPSPSPRTFRVDIANMPLSPRARSVLSPPRGTFSPSNSSSNLSMSPQTHKRSFKLKHSRTRSSPARGPASGSSS